MPSCLSELIADVPASTYSELENIDAKSFDAVSYSTESNCFIVDNKDVAIEDDYSQ